MYGINIVNVMKEVKLLKSNNFHLTLGIIWRLSEKTEEGAVIYY